MKRLLVFLLLALALEARAQAPIDTLFILRCDSTHRDTNFVLLIFKGMPQVFPEANPRKVKYVGTALFRDTLNVQYEAPDYPISGVDTAHTELRWTTEQDTIPSWFPARQYRFKNGQFQMK